MNEFSDENEAVEVSKSQRKREAHELLDLAKKLISMPDNQLKGLPLEDDLREEVDFARSIRSHGAKKRQLMTVGKMLRQRDTDELADAVSNINEKNRQTSARFHQIEAWRDRLIEGGDKDLSALLTKKPEINVQTLRQLIRNARREYELEKPPAAARKLFKLLRESDERCRLPPLPPD